MSTELTGIIHLEVIRDQEELWESDIYLNGECLDPKYSLAVQNHSPTGLSWGYHGSGPAQLALAILLELFGRRTALRHYQQFKLHVIGNLPQEGFNVKINLADYTVEHTTESSLEL